MSRKLYSYTTLPYQIKPQPIPVPSAEDYEKDNVRSAFISQAGTIMGISGLSEKAQKDWLSFGGNAAGVPVLIKPISLTDINRIVSNGIKLQVPAQK